MIYVLEISSWRGISIGAIHYYGKLMKITYPKITEHNAHEYGLDSFADNEIKIKQRINRKMASQLNRKDREEGFISIASGYKVGDLTDRFDTKEEVIEQAKSKYIRGSMKSIPLVITVHGKIYQPKPDSDE